MASRFDSGLTASARSFFGSLTGSGFKTLLCNSKAISPLFVHYSRSIDRSKSIFSRNHRISIDSSSSSSPSLSSSRVALLLGK